MSEQNPIYEVIILGGGISGLTCSFYLKETPHLLIEKSERFGGSILSQKKNGGVLECGPNFLLLRKNEAKDIILELGLDSELLAPSKKSQRRFVLLESGLVALTPLSLFKHFFSHSPLTNWKFCLGGASWARPVQGESVFDFFSRKFSKYFATNFARPMVSGIYGGDAKKIVMKLAFPLFAGFDEKFNSFWPGAFFHFLKKQKHSLSSGLYSFRDGLEYLPLSLVKKSKAVLQKETSVLSLNYEQNLWRIETSKGTFWAKNLVTTLPAYEMSSLLADSEPKLSNLLAAVTYPWLSVMFVAYKTEQIQKNPQGFGFLNALIEKKSLLGCFYTSSMFPSRFQGGETVFTIFIGGTLRQDLRLASHEQLSYDVQRELAQLYDIQGEAIWTELHPWEKAIPQYEAPVVALRDYLKTQKNFQGTLHFSTNYVAGVSVPDCMITAKEIAKKITSGGLHGSQI